MELEDVFVVLRWVKPMVHLCLFFYENNWGPSRKAVRRWILQHCFHLTGLLALPSNPEPHLYFRLRTGTSAWVPERIADFVPKACQGEPDSFYSLHPFIWEEIPSQPGRNGRMASYSKSMWGGSSNPLAVWGSKSAAEGKFHCMIFLELYCLPWGS